MAFARSRRPCASAAAMLWVRRCRAGRRRKASGRCRAGSAMRTATGCGSGSNFSGDFAVRSSRSPCGIPCNGVVGYFPALFTDTHRPVEFFVVEEIDVGHRPGFSGYFAPYHHRRAVGVGRVARRVERPVVGHPEADERVAQRDVCQGRISGELDMPRGAKNRIFGHTAPIAGLPARVSQR